MVNPGNSPLARPGSTAPDSYVPYETELPVLGEFSLFRNRECVTSLAAASGENVAATLGGHAGQEAKLADALDPLRLVCSLGGHVRVLL